jgi:hypothetical protein
MNNENLKCSSLQEVNLIVGSMKRITIYVGIAIAMLLLYMAASSYPHPGGFSSIGFRRIVLRWDP